MSTNAREIGLGIVLTSRVLGASQFLMFSNIMHGLKGRLEDAGVGVNAFNAALGKLAIGIGMVYLGLKNLKKGFDDVKAAADFSYQMAHVEALGAIYGDVNTQHLIARYMELGATYGYMIEEIAVANQKLIRAGHTPDMAADLSQYVLQLARVGNISVDTASDVLLAVKNSYGITQEELAITMDKLAYAANLGWIEIADFLPAFARWGGMAKGMNQDLEDMIALQVMLQDAGLSAERSATGVAMILTRLQAPSTQGLEGLMGLGIRVFDERGQYRSAVDILEDIYLTLDEQKSEAAMRALLSETEGFDESIQRELMQANITLREIFSQRPVRLVHIMGTRVGDVLGENATGLDYARALSTAMKENAEGFSAGYMEKLENEWVLAEAQLKSIMGSIKIIIGMTFLPVLVKIAHVVKPILLSILTFLQRNEWAVWVIVLGTILINIGLIIGGIIIIIGAIKVIYAGLIALGVIKAGLIATIGVVIIKVIAVIALLVLLYLGIKWLADNWTEVLEGVVDVAEFVWYYLKHLLMGLASLIIHSVNMLIEIFLFNLNLFIVSFINFINCLIYSANQLLVLADKIMGVFGGGLDFRIGHVDFNLRESIFGEDATFMNNFGNFLELEGGGFGWRTGAIGNPNIHGGSGTRFATGSMYIPSDTFAMLHKGEQVLQEDTAPYGGSGGNVTFVIQQMDLDFSEAETRGMDAKEIVEKVLKALEQKIDRSYLAKLFGGGR